MAELKEQNAAEGKILREPVKVAQLSVPTIVAALHENAITKSDAKSKGVKVVNSAIDNKSGKASLKSAGEHIISVLPLEAGKDVEKAVAVEVIKAYVQWFVGPDLANKVTDKTVKSLAESPDGSTNESAGKFMSFSKFLLEDSAEEDEFGEDGDEDDVDDADEGSEDDSAEEAEDGEDADEDADEDGEEGSEGEGDESGDEGGEDGEDGSGDDDEGGKGSASGAPGYYIPYSLKVEGLKQTALKDAMKKFASDLFDKVGFKIKGSGLFGSGEEIDVSVKKIKDAIKGIFGAIDPKKLKDGVSKEIGNKVEDPHIDILEKADIYKKYEKSLDPQAKAQISKAEYSLVITGKEKVPDKPTFNKRNIADIVQASIAGLYKKFKNKVTKNDVILIQVQDSGENDGVAEMTKKLLKIADLEKLLDGKHTYEEIVNKIKAALDPLAKDKKLLKNPLAAGCVKAWEKFYEKHKEKRLKKGYAGKDGKGHDDAEAMQQYFKPFVDAYKKQFKENKMYAKALSESAVSRLLSIAPRLRDIVLESLFHEADDEEEDFDDEDDELDEGRAEFDADAAKKAAEGVFSKELPDFSCTVKAGGKADLKSALSKYDVGQLDSSFGEYENGIAVDFGKMMSESVKDDILGILFEGDGDGLPDEASVKKAFDAVCSELGISDFGGLIALSPKAAKKKLNETDDDEHGISQEGLGKISDVFKGELINIAKAEAKITVKPIAKVAASPDVQSWLAERGLDSSEAKSKLAEFPYAAAFILKKPADVDGSGKLKRGSLGYSSYTKQNIKAAIDKAASGMEVDADVISFEQKSNGKLLYYKTKIPAECVVYVIGFKPPEESAADEEAGSGDDSKKASAYVLPVSAPDTKPGSDSGDADTDEDSGDSEEDSTSDDFGAESSFGGDSSQRKNTRDVYIIPMPGLKGDGSKDKED